MDIYFDKRVTQITKQQVWGACKFVVSKVHYFRAAPEMTGTMQLSICPMKNLHDKRMHIQFQTGQRCPWIPTVYIQKFGIGDDNLWTFCHSISHEFAELCGFNHDVMKVLDHVDKTLGRMTFRYNDKWWKKQVTEASLTWDNIARY